VARKNLVWVCITSGFHFFTSFKTFQNLFVQNLGTGKLGIISKAGITKTLYQSFSYSLTHFSCPTENTTFKTSQHHSLTKYLENSSATVSNPHL
jgi:hypothetical protein